MSARGPPADGAVSALHPYGAHVRDAAAAGSHRAWRPEDGPLPALYLSHGAPPLFEDADWMARLFAWARALPRPRAILIASAHWESAPLALSSASAGTPLVYDFAGFDPVYFRFRYPTPDATELAGLVAGVLPDGSGLVQHTARGLDHGAWVPLMAMYPEADIPVLQLSIPTDVSAVKCHLAGEIGFVRVLVHLLRYPMNDF